MTQQTKPKLGPVRAEKKPYLWRDLFRNKVFQALDGKAPAKNFFATPEGQEVISTAKAETTAALGYTLEEAIKADEIEDLTSEIRWNRERTGREELANDSPEEIM